MGLHAILTATMNGATAIFCMVNHGCMLLNQAIQNLRVKVEEGPDQNENSLSSDSSTEILRSARSLQVSFVRNEFDTITVRTYSTWTHVRKSSVVSRQHAPQKIEEVVHA